MSAPWARDRRLRLAARRGATLLLCLTAACGAEPSRDDAGAASPVRGVTAVDDAGRETRLPQPASLILSLVPSATETLIALGAADRLVARTDFDAAPETLHLPSIGGGLDPSLEAVVALRPQLVIVWRETQNPRLRNQLEQAGIAVFALRTRDTTDILRTVARLGTLVGRDSAADSLSSAIRAELAAVSASVADRPRPAVFYAIWDDPPMTAGPETFIAQLIEVAGGRSIFPDLAADWPTVSLEEVVRRQPDVIVRPEGERQGRPIARLREAPGWRDLPAVRDGRIIGLPADLLNRPGPHIGRAAGALRDALHPELRGAGR